MNRKQINSLKFIMIFLIYILMAIGIWIITLPNVIAGIIMTSIMILGMVGIIYNYVWEEITKKWRMK